MKLLILAIFIAAINAEKINLNSVEKGELYVPENQEEYLANLRTQDLIEQQRDPRIGNGINATDSQFAFALRVRFFETNGAIFVCSGVIISPSFILTVRHCFDPVLTFQVIAYAGSVHLNSPEMIERISTRFWFAPAIDGWNPDLAVCELSTPFPINNRVNYIRLPSRSQATYDFNGYPIQIIGWGRNRDGDMTQILKWAAFRIEVACWNNRRPTHMCSEPVEGWHVNTRGGDSGGPWITYESGQATLIALTEGSTGTQARWWFRGTRLSAFLDFIGSVAQDVVIRP